MSKNMPADAMQGPYAQQQKMLLYVLPVVFAVGGIAFPIGVLIYWTTSNLWTMGQQFYVIRNNPAPGTPAARAKEARDAAKRQAKGVAEPPSASPEASSSAPPGSPGSPGSPPPPQRRQQPKKQSREQRRKSRPKGQRPAGGRPDGGSGSPSSSDT
jgi:YidC/Oxa1 family membrane protein insertase